jgi:endonuclease G, mitochondrial
VTRSQNQLARLRRYNVSIREDDPKLAEEVRDRGFEAMVTEALSPEAVEEMLGLESIAMRTQRPVLAISNNVTQLVFIDEADSKIWGERLTQARPLLDAAIPAVGRIDLTGAELDWVGSGWLVAENIIVTNRHVAREFAEHKGDGFKFKMGLIEQMNADVDFLQEIDNPKKLIFKLVRPLHIEEPPGPDVAFFEIETVSGDAKLAEPIDLASTVATKQQVATIGYPAYDSRIPESDLMERIYGKV